MESKHSKFENFDRGEKTIAANTSLIRMTTLNKNWEQTQIKVFSRWCNKYCQQAGMKVEDCTQDFEDGVKLITLLEIVGKEPMPGKWHKTPKMRIQKLENCDLAIKYISEVKKVRLVGIGSNNIVDHDTKLTLGLIWSVINKFVIEEITVEEATARDALLLWCKKNTQGYEGVDVTNFTSSWTSGLAFCALINHFRPELLDYNALDKANHPENCRLAFEACKQLGITVYLDVEDIADTQPDEKSVVTQVSEFFHFFASDTKADQMAEKLKNTVGIQREIKDMTEAYIQACQVAIAEMDAKSAEIADDSFDKDTKGIKQKLVNTIAYGKDGRPKIFELKANAVAAYSALQLKCKATKRPMPEIPEEYIEQALNQRFEQLDQQVSDRRSELLGLLNDKVKSYVSQAKEVQGALEALDKELDSIEGELEQKKEALNAKVDKIRSKHGDVEALAPIYNDIEEAEMHLEIDETPSFIESIYNATIAHATTLIREIEAAIAAAKGLEISEEQLASFHETFNHFDKDHSKSLQYYELRACLTALGEDFTDDQAKETCKKYSASGEEKLNFDEYVKFMLDHFNKAETNETTMEAFKTIANGNPVLNDAQLDRYFSAEDAAFLRQELPQVEGGYDFQSWVNKIYA